MRNRRVYLCTIVIVITILCAVLCGTCASAKVWDESVVDTINSQGNPYTVAVIGDKLAVAFIDGPLIVYKTYDPDDDEHPWKEETRISSDIPVSEYHLNKNRLIKMVDWNGHPAIIWQGAIVPVENLWDHYFNIYFAYEDETGWHKEVLTTTSGDRHVLSFLDLKIGPDSVPYIAATGVGDDNCPLGLWHRLPSGVWTGEWIDEQGDYTWEILPSLAFDNGLPRVAYWGSDHRGGYTEKPIFIGLRYNWKDANGQWHPMNVHGTPLHPTYSDITLLFDSNHKPHFTFVTTDYDGAPQDFYHIYDNGNPTYPWNTETPFTSGEGTSPSAILEYRPGSGDYLHVAYIDTRYKTFGYRMRSQTGFDKGIEVRSNILWVSPKITLFHGSPVIVSYNSTGYLYCSRYIDPKPEITGISPETVQTGTVLAVVHVTGNKFNGNDVVFMGRDKHLNTYNSLPTNYISPTELTFGLSQADMASRTTYNIHIWRQQDVVWDKDTGYYPSLIVIPSPSPVVNSISPASGPGGSKIEVTVSGSGYYGSTPEAWQSAPYPGLKLTRADNPEYSGTITSWNQTSLTATFDLPAMGLWNVVVINPDGKQDVLTNGFTVIPVIQGLRNNIDSAGPARGPGFPLDKLPCIAGGKRCGEMCVDLLADPNNCGACARTCPSGETCENGQCILRIRDKPENKAWYDIFLSIPGTLMFFIQGSPAPDPQTTGSVQTAGSVSVVNIPQGSSDEAQEGSMHIVVLPDRDELRMETIQDAGKIVPDIPPALPEPQVVIIQEHMIAGTIESPRETTSPEPRAIIPENYIGSKPQILPIKFTCPAGYVTCNGQCVDLMTDTAYCGSCNSTCPSQFTCVAGVCTSQCNSGQTLCNGACVNLLTDPNNCGSCGNVCTNGAACESGQCVLPMVKIQTTRPGDIGKVRF